jgi:hypothetical protein
MVPVLMIGTYIQVKVQASELQEIFSYLPQEVQEKHRRPDELVFSTMYRTGIIGAMFILAHYLQHLDLCILTIKSYLIQK